MIRQGRQRGRKLKLFWRRPPAFDLEEAILQKLREISDELIHLLLLDSKFFAPIAVMSTVLRTAQPQVPGEAVLSGQINLNEAARTVSPVQRAPRPVLFIFGQAKRMTAGETLNERIDPQKRRFQSPPLLLSAVPAAVCHIQVVAQVQFRQPVPTGTPSALNALIDTVQTVWLAKRDP